MSKVKNVTTEHYIAELPENGSEPNYLRLAKGILEVGSENDEETEEFAYYDGDGTPETEVLSIKKNMPFEGHFVASDPAQQLIEEKEFATGDDRKIMYKQVRSDGKTLEGEATLQDVNVTGGPAEEYRPINGTISWNRVPDVTNNGDNGNNDPEG